MFKWVLEGLKTGIVTTLYPDKDESAPGVTPGLPVGQKEEGEEALSVVSRCPTVALSREDQQITVDYQRCVHCFRCLRCIKNPIDWQNGYEWAASTADIAAGRHKLGKAFGRSLHIRVVDAGACGACLSEIEQINKPYYNIHRLGFFITPTPRDADVLLVAGPVTDHMRMPLKKAYDAMPTPKGVVAVGACALSGGVFGPSFASGAGVSELIPADIMIPGCPPPPLAIIHGLLVMVERRVAASLTSPKSKVGGKHHA
jgi:Ni,Fe-hydrogenase III small subunit/ferredoxin-like protein FixX